MDHMAVYVNWGSFNYVGVLIRKDLMLRGLY